MRLTKLEKDALALAAEFVLAGEWPWTHDPEAERHLTPAQRVNRAYDREFDRAGWPCHCYDHCEDDDEGVVRRLKCRLRE